MSEMSLRDIEYGKCYAISGFKDDSEYTEKLHKMGFVKGTVIKLAQIKISDPRVYRIRSSRIALRLKESERILVEEIDQ